MKQEKGHEGVKLGGEDLNRLITWMDLYAQKLGCFSDAQEKDLLRLREAWADMLVARSAP